MPVYKDKKNGTYYFRVYYKDEFGNTKQTSRRGFRTKQEARDALRLFEPIREYELKKAAEEEKKKSIILFENLIEDFFFEESKRIKITTLDNNKYYFNKHILPFFKEKEISSITPKDIQTWQNEMLKKDISNRFINKVYGILKTYFRYLENFYNLKSNPCNKVFALREKNDQIKELENETNICEKENYAKFIATFSLDKELSKIALFDTMYKAGTRKSETRALKWKDIDFEKHTISINKQLRYSSNGSVLISTKSETSNRLIFLCKSLEKTLKQLFEIEKMKYGDNISELYVFGGINPIGANTIDKSREKHIKIANIPHFTNHELRHSYGSNMLNDGFDIKYVSEQMGHESIAITLKTYHHLLLNTQEQNRIKYYDNY